MCTNTHTHTHVYGGGQCFNYFCHFSLSLKCPSSSHNSTPQLVTLSPFYFAHVLVRCISLDVGGIQQFFVSSSYPLTYSWKRPLRSLNSKPPGDAPRPGAGGRGGGLGGRHTADSACADPAFQVPTPWPTLHAV